MRTILIMMAIAAGALGVLAILIHPSLGLLYERPGVALGVGLIGLGICQEARKRFVRLDG